MQQTSVKQFTPGPKRKKAKWEGNRHKEKKPEYFLWHSGLGCDVWHSTEPAAAPGDLWRRSPEHHLLLCTHRPCAYPGMRMEDVSPVQKKLQWHQGLARGWVGHSDGMCQLHCGSSAPHPQDPVSSRERLCTCGNRCALLLSAPLVHPAPTLGAS